VKECVSIIAKRLGLIPRPLTLGRLILIFHRGNIEVKISNKISLVILITGISVLTILSLAVYTLNRTMVIKADLKHSEIHAKELSSHINRFLSEKVKMVMMMATSTAIKKGLEISNLCILFKFHGTI